MTDAIGETVQDMVEQCAFSLARHQRLVCDDGEILCWQCREQPALLPVLHCPHCLHASRQKLNLHEPVCIARTQTEADKKRALGETP